MRDFISHYRIEWEIGRGGMGVVYRAVDTRLGRSVAIKIVDERFAARFEREARAIASLNHPHICTLYDVGANYLVMELLEGETIAERLKSGPLHVDEALRYAGQIAAALAEAHGRGIVHRDLKPGNIMLTKAGAKILDFGLATWEGDQTVSGGRMMGTPAYMAPEQREGTRSDVRTDIYSFGCVLYEMLTAAEKLAREKSKLFPNGTVWNAVQLPAIRAAIELQRGEPAKAVDLLASATPYERAYPEAVYLRGMAYLRLRKGAEAAAEFQKILDHKGASWASTWKDPNWGLYYAISCLGVARASKLAGDEVKAKQTFQSVFTLWKDADPEMPVLIQAKKDYAVFR